METQSPRELDDFASEVRAFLDEALTPALRREGELCAGIYADQPVAKEWLQILNEKGWAVPHWPVEYGGTGWSVAKQQVFQRELALASAPSISPNSTHMVGPVLIAFGTDQQKDELLPRIRSGEDWWAQGYSEPGAGSDLASLKCKAVRDGNDYVLNGSKIWTTHAQWSNKMFCLVRTDSSGKPQTGITFLLLDLDLPGITISPIYSISGDHELNQVFFDDVRVPASGLVGEENDGWTVAKYLLQHERASLASPFLRVALRKVKQAAMRELGAGGRPLLEDPAFALKITETEIALKTLEALEMKVFSAASAGQPVGVLSSVVKIRFTELRQRVSELGIEAAGPFVSPLQPEARMANSNVAPVGPEATLTFTPEYLNHRAASIYGGSNEVQRNIIAKYILRR